MTTMDRYHRRPAALEGGRALAVALFFGLIAALPLTAAAEDGDVLDTVQQTGVVRCGTENSPVSAEQRPDGTWHGFDVDFCRAIAAAVLGNADLIEILPLNLQLRIPALEAGNVDALFANLTWTYGRDVGQPIDYAAVILYDGQSFLGFANEATAKVTDLKDITVCVQRGTTTEVNLDAFIRTHSLSWTPLVLQSAEGANEAFIGRRCTLQTNDRSFLVGWRAVTGLPDLHLYSEVISKEPLSAAVRIGDNNWLEIVRWVIFALITAEEQGINQANIDQMKSEATDPAQRPILGDLPEFGAPLGLKDDWAYQVIRQVGNYAEIFERNLGERSRLKMDRGLNRLWSEGGLLYAPPLR